MCHYNDVQYPRTEKREKTAQFTALHLLISRKSVNRIPQFMLSNINEAKRLS